MKLLTYRTPSGYALGIWTEEGVLDVSAARQSLALGSLPDSMEGVITGGPSATAALSDLVRRAKGRPELFRPEAELSLGPCVPNPGKIICIGLNYRRHALELGLPIPQSPVLFSKFHNTLAAPSEPVPLPPNATTYDYEAELVAVLGRRARYVSEAEALDYVFGYCAANDLTTRELQNRTPQWLLGKTQDKFLPLGPYLVTADEVGDPQALGVRCWVNEELRQNSSTGDMVFTVAQLVSYISQHFTLEAGDIISTGTPAGVVAGMKEKVWLKPGDTVTVELDRLGRLNTPLVAE